MVTAELTTAAERCEAFAGRVFGSVLASIDLVSIYIGDRLGYYRALADLRKATPGELALRTGTFIHYAAQAGFQAVEILPIENDVWRFYRLTA